MNAIRRLSDSLFGRLSLGLVVIQGLLIPLFGYWALSGLARTQTDDFINQSLAKTLVIGTLADSSPDSAALHRALDDLVLTGHAVSAIALPPEARPLTDEAFTDASDPGNPVYRTVVRTDGGGGATLVIDYDKTPTIERIATMERSGRWLGLLLLLSSVTATAVFGFSLTRSLNRLISLARRLGRNDFDGAPAVSSSLTEVRTLESALLDMRGEIEQTTRAMGEKQAILDSALTGIMTISSEGHIQTANLAITEITGYDQVALQGTLFAQLVVDHDRPAFTSMLVTPSGRSIQEVQLQHCLGHTVTVRIGFSEVEIHGEPFFTLAMQNVTDQREVATTQYWLSCDPLTGLPNRSALMKYLASSIEFSRRNGTIGAVLFIDFDRFKEINDTLGHAAGDLFLQAAAARFSQYLRSRDFIARFAGDEFVVVVNGLGRSEDVDILAEGLLAAFEAPLEVGGKEMFASFSIGVSRFPEHGTSVEGLLHCADVAMYTAKRAGGGSHAIFSRDDGDARVRKMQLETQLHRALEKGEFHLDYQPIYELATHELARFEALLRWNNPLLGVISPTEFISLCEKNGLIVPIGEWVLSTAFDQVIAWQRLHGLRVGVSVNLSGRQLGVRNLAQRLATCADLTVSDCPPIDLEITESSIIEVGARSVEIMKELRAAGFSLSIDDFGTGYSSLAYLSKFPVNCLKIDRSFVADLGGANDTRGIVAAVVAMGSSLGMKVVAEGVETAAQLHALQEMGCGYGQGFLLGRPLSLKAAGELVADAATRKRRASLALSPG